MTNQTNLTDDSLTHDRAMIPALSSITSNQVDTVANIVRASGQEWDVQATDDYDGYCFILLETVGHGDEQKSFFVAGAAHCLELFESKDESLALIGTFSTMTALKAQLISVVGTN